MLQRHGSVTVGETLRAAYHKLEKLEHSAHVFWVAQTMGQVISLSPEEIANLARMREQLGIGPAEDVYRTCGVPRPE